MAIATDPRQTRALINYKDPASETFGNLKQSMIKAGFPITSTNSVYTNTPLWLSESLIQDVDAIKQAESNLRKYNSIKVDIMGDNKNAIDIAKLQVDVSKFILKTLAKQKYSDTEDKQLPDVQINIVNYSDTKPLQATEATVTDNTAI